MNEVLKLAKELQEYTKVVGSHNIHIQEIANELVEALDQPTLNKNQQIVLEYLKSIFLEYGGVRGIFHPIYSLLEEPWGGRAKDSYGELTLEEEVQVLQVFSQQALEQEEE